MLAVRTHPYLQCNAVVRGRFFIRCDRGAAQAGFDKGNVVKKRLLAQASMAPVKKIGFITPSSNTALEPLTYMMLSNLTDVVSVHFSRLPVKTLTLDDRDVGQFQTEKVVQAAVQLQDAAVDAILWNGTSGGWSGKGLTADRELCAAITAATGIPASTSSLAQAEAFAAYDMTRYGLAVPYVEGPTNKMLETYRDEGFDGVSHAALGVSVNTIIGATPFDRIRELLRQADSEQAQCLMVGCTNWPATPLIDEMEAALGKPVFDSIAVTLWKALRMVGIQRPIHGWGGLLRRHPVVDRLDTLLAQLRAATKAGRTTIRMDIPAMNIDADDVYSEAVAPGIPPLKLDSSLNQRSLGTVRWLEENQQLLVQDDCVNAEVPPPKALIGKYGVKAQMLGPLVWRKEVVGWISVHHVEGTRRWTSDETAMLAKAVEDARKIFEDGGWVKPD
jgi:maleate isomerase